MTTAAEPKPRKLRFTYEDKNEYQGTTHYPVANESVRRWREVLADVTVKVAGGIAGGGEISLFGILPSATERAVFIDHSYISLWALVGKFHTIEKLGADEAVKLLRCPPGRVQLAGGYNVNGQRVKNGEYNAYGEFVGDRNPFSHKLVDRTKELYTCFLEGNKGTPTETDRMQECGWWPLPGLDAKWQEITPEDCQGLLDSKVDLQIYHGDISDLTEHAPLGLLYLSNALSYSGRNGTDFKIDKIVEKGSLLAWTGSAGYDPYGRYSATATKEMSVGGVKCKLVEQKKPRAGTATPRTVQDGSWAYSLAEIV